MKVYHWWPGRQYAGPCPIPSMYTKLAKDRGSKYLTVAKEYQEGIGWVYGFAFCCPKDVPSRKMGREIAIGRLLSWMVDNVVNADNALSG